MLHKTITVIVSPTLFWAVSAAAQETGGCQTKTLKNPARVVYQCSNGLTIEAETQAALEAILPEAKAAPKAVSIRNRAILISLPKGSGPFQVKTPHAIASVRGTVYVVDATPTQTSVFVIEGLVKVARKSRGGYGARTASLSAGDGVVASGDDKLIVKKWPKEKVSALLARFSR